MSNCYANLDANRRSERNIYYSNCKSLLIPAARRRRPCCLDETMTHPGAGLPSKSQEDLGIPPFLHSSQIVALTSPNVASIMTSRTFFRSVVCPRPTLTVQTLRETAATVYLPTRDEPVLPTRCCTDRDRRRRRRRRRRRPTGVYHIFPRPQPETKGIVEQNFCWKAVSCMCVRTYWGHDIHSNPLYRGHVASSSSVSA